MAGRKLNNIEDYERSLRNGYGLGSGSDYKPWLRSQDVPSVGNRYKIESLKTGRIHHFLSGIEKELFYLLEFCDHVIDIREQFPLLPIDLAGRIATGLEVKYPAVPKSGASTVMTTDFLVTTHCDGRIGYEAISVKDESALENARTLEKLEIERVWWALLGIPFKFYLRNEYTKVQSENIAWARSALRDGHVFDGPVIERTLPLISEGKHLIRDLCASFEKEHDLAQTDAYTLFRLLVANKHISVDMTVPLQRSEIVDVLSIQDICEETKYANFSE